MLIATKSSFLQLGGVVVSDVVWSVSLSELLEVLPLREQRGGRTGRGSGERGQRAPLAARHSRGIRSDRSTLLTHGHAHWTLHV